MMLCTAAFSNNVDKHMRNVTIIRLEPGNKQYTGMII